MKKCIIFSYGPVPLPEQDKVEGGGLRCWGLAQGLKAQDPDMQLTVAFNDSYRKENQTTSFQGIDITTWRTDTIKDLIVDFDTVIVSYCMGDLSVEVARSVNASQQLVLDCYVPIYVEISARQSENLEGEYAAFSSEINRWSEVLRRGDLYLCANENQKRYYQGVLSALGRINPATYEDEMILVVPYGIYREDPKPTSRPVDALLNDGSSGKKGKTPYKKLLWFGGIYPWFDIKTLIKAVAEVNKSLPVKLVIVGAKNPFNGHPDFIKSYEDLVEYIDSDETHRKNVVLQDWVEFNDRANWYLNSDLVILINKTGEENELAWRTRLVDYIWADLPIITNGGDPLGEELLKHDAAARLTDLSAPGLARDISKLLADPKTLISIKGNIKKVRTKYYWDVVTEKLAVHINRHSRPRDIREFGLLDVVHPGSGVRNLTGKVATKARKLPAYYRKYGMRSTLHTIQTIAAKRIGRLSPRKNKKVIFVAHQLDTTGAPHVFIDMVSLFVKKHPKTDVEFHTFNPADKVNIRALNKAGIRPQLHLNKDMAMSLVKGDVVVLNTVAFSDTLKNSVFSSLENNVAERLVWYIHEDEPELIFDEAETARIKSLLLNDKITIFVAAVKTRDNYKRHFGVDKNILIQLYRIKMPKNRHKIRDAKDFDSLRFALPGMMGDTRKGQLPVAYAFIEFKRRYYDVNPALYRNFSLLYIGVGKDFPSRQLLKHTARGLGEHFTHFGPIPHAACLDKVMDANITICYSLRECLPMYVYEGMVAGHPLMRNDSSGMEEQLKEGVNGFYLDSEDFEQLIQQIERITNKKKTSNTLLASMSKASHDMTLELEDIEYDELIDFVQKTFAHRNGE